MSRSAIVAGLMLASCLAVPAQAQQAAFAVSGTPDTLGNPPFTLGYAFSLSEAFTASALGVYDAGGDGLASFHEIGLWDAGGTLLASTSLTGLAGSLSDGFRYASISPLLLEAGSYTIGATYTDGLDHFFYNAAITPLAGVSYVGNRYASGSALTLPTNATGETGYFGPNLLLGAAAVPEPATWALLLLGFGAVGGALRTARRQKLTVTYA